MHVGDVAWRINRSNSFNPTNAIQLWTDVTSDDILGMGWYTAAHHGVDMLVAEQAKATGLEKRILTWAEQKFRQFPYEQRGNAELKIQVQEWDTEREQLLSNAGYRRDMFHYVWFKQPLSREIDKVSLHSGFTIQPVSESHAAERAELHNLAFFVDDVTKTSYLQVIASSVYRPKTDLVAVAPDGRLAAFALGWIDPVLKTGLFEPVGTHPDFRRLGLAKALLFAGMESMQAAGMRSALVYTESPNLNAQKLYRSAGFSVEGRQFDWVRASIR